MGEYRLYRRKKRLETNYKEGKQIGRSIEHDEGDQTVYEDDY